MTHGVGGSVELAGAIVATTDDSPNGAGGFHDDHSRLARVIAFAIQAQVILDNILGVLLQAAVQRGADGQHPVCAQLSVAGEVPDLSKCPVQEPVRTRLMLAVDRLCRVLARCINLAFGQKVGLDHIFENVVCAGARSGQIDVGSIAGRSLE